MELRIITQTDPGVLPEINWNHEELKNDIARKAAEYRSIAYTDAQAAEMKKDRAALNKLVTAFESERKRIKKFYNAPYEKFESQVKEVLAPVKDAIAQIDEGLEEIERQYRIEKKGRMLGFYERFAAEAGLKGLVPFEKLAKEELYKRSFNDKKLEQYFSDSFRRISSDIDSIRTLPERFQNKVILEYVKNLSLSEALQEGKRLEELEKVLEERQQKREEEARRETAREAKAEGEGRESAGTAEAVQKAATVSGGQKSGLDTKPAVEENICRLDFRVWGTRQQIMGLRQYMIDNGIKFGKVE